MYRLIASVKKEILLLFSDKVGLIFMFLMPVVLVLIISIIQNSAFRKINENQITLLVVNKDFSSESLQLIELFKKSGMFLVEEDNNIEPENIKHTLISKNKQVALFIPFDFSLKLREKSEYISDMMLADFNLNDSAKILDTNLDISSNIKLYHDPILQDAYCQSIISVIKSYVQIIESSLLLEVMYEQLGFNQKPHNVVKAMEVSSVNILQVPASEVNITPNATQHNIPAWTIFAMFFVVVSLGNNIVKERLNSSFLRLKTMPVSFVMILGSKMIVYLTVTLLQILVIFSIGAFVFPYINLPKLIIPFNIPVLFIVCLFTALSAVNYAIMIGTLAKTQEQANGIGAASVIIFAALGGIIVPIFVMPVILQYISYFSPLRWCLEGFYFLFLRGGDMYQLFLIILPQIIFIIICQIITYIQLKVEKIM